MRVELSDISKNFQGHSVFKGVNLSIPEGFKGVILGGNGSGKSTLLKVISGALAPSKGKIEYYQNDKAIDPGQAFKQLSFCGPYTDLIEDFTLTELLDFHGKFKPFRPNVREQTILDRLQLQRFEGKPIKTYSSGMKQRVRLALTLFSNTSLVLLDEPTSNLDPQGKTWYSELVADLSGNRTILVSSNFLEEEYAFTEAEISLEAYR